MSTAVSSDVPTAPSTADRPLVMLETSRALPLVSITVAQMSGSVIDPPGKEGLSRFAARLMRRTGGGLTPQLLDTRIDSLGGSLGADVAPSSAAFHGTVIARSLEPFVNLLIDVLARPGFAEEEFGRLKRETESELVEARDNDRSLARRWFRRKLFGDHPYARSVSGSVSSVRRYEPTDVEPLYRRAVTQQNVVFAFAGDIDVEQALDIADRIAKALPRGSRLPDEVSEPDMAKGRRLIVVDKPERTQTQILIGGLGSHPRDADHVALHVANTIFGGTFTARMTREIRSKRGWSYGAYSHLPYDRQRQAFSMWTFPKASDAAACIRLELDMLKEWRERGVTKRELAWAKRYLVRSHAFSIDTASKRVGLKLDRVLYNLPDDYHEKYMEHVQAVTLEQANLAVRSRISEENLLVAVVGTEADLGQAVRDAIEDLSECTVVPFDSDD